MTPRPHIKPTTCTHAFLFRRMAPDRAMIARVRATSMLATRNRIGCVLRRSSCSLGKG